MRRIGFLMIILVHFLSIHSQAEILIEDDEPPVFQSAVEFSSKVKQGSSRPFLGLGLSGAGVSGTLGGHLELNLTNKVSMVAGFGIGKGFDSLQVKVKNSLYSVGRWIKVYAAFGYSRWFVRDRTPSRGSLVSRFSSRKADDANNSGNDSSENLLFPSLGMQYYQFSGPWEGGALYTEIQILSDLGDFVFVPVGEVGVVYYFR